MDLKRILAHLIPKKNRFPFSVYQFSFPRSGAGFCGTALNRQASTFNGGCFSALEGRTEGRCVVPCFLLWIAMAGKLLYYCSGYPVDEGAVGRCLVYSILSHRGFCAVVCKLSKQRLQHPNFSFSTSDVNCQVSTSSHLILSHVSTVPS